MKLFKQLKQLRGKNEDFTKTEYNIILSNFELDIESC